MGNWRDSLFGFGLVIQLTVIVVVAGVGPLLLGVFFDRLLHTAPFITLFLMVLGTTLGTIAVYRQVNEVYKRVGGGKK